MELCKQLLAIILHCGFQRIHSYDTTTHRGLEEKETMSISIITKHNAKTNNNRTQKTKNNANNNNNNTKSNDTKNPYKPPLTPALARPYHPRIHRIIPAVPYPNRIHRIIPPVPYPKRPFYSCCLLTDWPLRRRLKAPILGAVYLGHLEIRFFGVGASVDRLQS